MAKKMIIKGVGTFMAKKPGSGEVLTLGHLQNLKIDLNTEIDDIFGGDGMFAIDTLVRSKSIDVSATDAKFDLNTLQLMMGSTVHEAVEDTVWVLNEEALPTSTGTKESQEVEITMSAGATIVAGTINVSFPDYGIDVDVIVPSSATTLVVANKLAESILDLSMANGGNLFEAADIGSSKVKIDYLQGGNRANVVLDMGATGFKATVTPTDGTAGTTTFNTEFEIHSELAIREKVTNKTLQRVNGTPAVGQFSYTAGSKLVTTHDSVAGLELLVNYRREETVDLVPILVDEVPFPVTVVHHGSFLQKDGSYQGVETELYSCRAKGTFSIDAARSSASASSVSLSVIDPERSDGRLGVIKRFASQNRV